MHLAPPMKTKSQLQRLIFIIKKLRSAGGCPWDRKQTHASLKQHLLEEAYEVLEAIDEKNPEKLKDELGDLLLQVVLHAQIATDHKEFTIEDVAQMISEKLIRRHPHVFGKVKVKDADEVVVNWEKIKVREREKSEVSTLDSVPKIFPALHECYKISKKASQLGFDWKRPIDCFKKVHEEIDELKSAIRSGKRRHITEEMGDILFAMSNLCRLYQINPEIALHESNKKFRGRFRRMEALARKHCLAMNKLSFDEWEELYAKAKT